jgi:hypothetical protein
MCAHRLWDSATVFYQRYTLVEMMGATGLRGDIADKLGTFRADRYCCLHA